MWDQAGIPGCVWLVPRWYLGGTDSSIARYLDGTWIVLRQYLASKQAILGWCLGNRADTYVNPRGGDAGLGQGLCSACCVTECGTVLVLEQLCLCTKDTPVPLPWWQQGSGLQDTPRAHPQGWLEGPGHPRQALAALSSRPKALERGCSEPQRPCPPQTWRCCWLREGS